MALILLIFKPNQKLAKVLKVEIGYQGMLLTQQGDFAWTTNETEAMSSGETRLKKDWSPCRSKGCPKPVVGVNFAEFPSVYYEDRKSVVRVSW